MQNRGQEVGQDIREGLWPAVGQWWWCVLPTMSVGPDKPVSMVIVNATPPLAVQAMNAPTSQG